MKKHLLFIAALALTGAGTVYAHQYKLGPIAIGHPWARPTAEGARAGAAYLTLENTAAEPDRFVGASSPVAATAQLHETTMNGGVMKMHEAEGGVALPPGQTVAFKPGSYHIMLIGLKHRLVEGEHVPLTLNFQKAGSIDVEVYVEKSPNGDHEGGMMHGHGMDGMDHGAH